MIAIPCSNCNRVIDILFSNMGGVHYPMFEKGVCDKCRSEKIDKVLRRGLKERIKEWWNDVNIL